GEDPLAFKEYERKFPGTKYAPDAAWRRIRKSSNWQDFKSYLGIYPRSIYADYASFRADQLFWEEADRANTLAAFKAYLSEFPKGIHAAAASFQIEERIWSEVHTADDHKTYLKEYPNGRYAQIAKLLMQPPPNQTVTVAPVPVLSIFTSPPVPNARVVV